jgi:hypothetical protein
MARNTAPTLLDVALRYADNAEKSFNEARKKFIKEVEGNPSAAIRWASNIMETQAEYECWLLVRRYLGLVGTDSGSKIGINTDRAAIEKAVEAIRDDLMSSIGNGESTSLCSRAQHTAEQVARKNTLPRIESVLRCEGV